MSAQSALKGYRTQFLYSLYYILNHQDQNYTFRLEGEEDLDILDADGKLLFAIQVKNLSETITLSNLITEDRTSFLRRFTERYPFATPILVSFGPISSGLKNWETSRNNISSQEVGLIRKYQLTNSQWLNIKNKIRFDEITETDIIDGIINKLRNYAMVDPIPTAEILLYWLQTIAEKGALITTGELLGKIENIGKYLSQRIAISEQYGVFIKPLHHIEIAQSSQSKLKSEFFQGTSARYEHVLMGLDVARPHFIEEISNALQASDVIIIHGASGQGKSTLAYRYARSFAPSSLLYELLIQNNPAEAIKAVIAITSMVKNLKTPMLLVIHVTPGTVEWLKLVRELANNELVKILVTIRQDDWFRATAVGIDFKHESIELQLLEKEAANIYANIDKETPIRHYADFEEAWIKLGSGVPLLEFIYSLVQGDSLKNKLKQQILQISSEQTNVNTQLDLLRIVSLSDTLNAQVEISKISHYQGLQFILEKFEREFLLKLSEDRKCIIGLHPVRSAILIEILFDEFTTYKSEYSLQCLHLIRDADAYVYLLQAFRRRLLEPHRIVSSLSDAVVTWTLYNNIRKCLSWLGLRDYIERNQKLFDAAYDRVGGGWLLVLDIYHGGTLDLQKMHLSDFYSEEFRAFSKTLTAQLTDKSENYAYVTNLFNSVSLPYTKPQTPLDWQSLGEILFWLKHLPNRQNSIKNIDDEDFKSAFERLDLPVLSKVMFGMFYYSPEYNKIREKYLSVFLSKLRNRYKIPLLQVDSEVTINFIVDPLSEKQNSNLHAEVIEIIDLVRYALPDKLRYNTQGYGHRFRMFSGIHDDTHKTIPIENLPAEEWTSLNSITNRLFEFSKRPLNWESFHEQLSGWEVEIQDRLQQLNDCLLAYRKGGYDTEHLHPIVNRNSIYTFRQIPLPQSVSDPFGIYGKAESKTDIRSTDSNTVNFQLTTKYDKFFKSYSDLHSGIENFINRVTKITEAMVQAPANVYNNNQSVEINASLKILFDTIEKYPAFREHKQLQFKRYAKHSQNIFTEQSLISTAFIWKDFIGKNRITVSESPALRMSRLKGDFVQKIIKGCKQINRKTKYKVEYIHDDDGSIPIFLVDTANPCLSLLGMKEIYDVLKAAIDAPDYSSLKQLMLQKYFLKFRFILLTHGKILKKEWIEFPQYLFRDKSFEEIAFYHSVPKPIDPDILSALNLDSWSEVLSSKFDEVSKFSVAYTTILTNVEHVSDLDYFTKIELDEEGTKMVGKQLDISISLAQKSFQEVLNYFTLLLKIFPYDDTDTSELQSEYWRLLFDIRNKLFPTETDGRENYEAVLDMEIIKNWAVNLSESIGNVGLLTLLLYGKYIDAHLKEIKS